MKVGLGIIQQQHNYRDVHTAHSDTPTYMYSDRLILHNCEESQVVYFSTHQFMFWAGTDTGCNTTQTQLKRQLHSHPFMYIFHSVYVHASMLVNSSHLLLQQSNISALHFQSFCSQPAAGNQDSVVVHSERSTTMDTTWIALCTPTPSYTAGHAHIQCM